MIVFIPWIMMFFAAYLVLAGLAVQHINDDMKWSEILLMPWRKILDLLGWYKEEKKKGLRLVQDMNGLFIIQSFRGTLTWKIVWYTSDEQVAYETYNRMAEEYKTRKEETIQAAAMATRIKKAKKNAGKIQKILR